MWIKNTAAETKPLRSLRNEHTDGELVTFTATGKAQVPAAIGDALCAEYDHLAPVENGGESDT